MSTRIEVAFRGEGQFLPGGSLPFENEGEMVDAIFKIAESLGLTVPEGIPFTAIFTDVKSGLGWDYHSSVFGVEIPIGGGTIIVRRHAINSCVPSAKRRNSA